MGWAEGCFDIWSQSAKTDLLDGQREAPKAVVPLGMQMHRLDNPGAIHLRLDTQSFHYKRQTAADVLPLRKSQQRLSNGHGAVDQGSTDQAYYLTGSARWRC